MNQIKSTLYSDHSSQLHVEHRRHTLHLDGVSYAPRQTQKNLTFSDYESHNEFYRENKHPLPRNRPLKYPFSFQSSSNVQK